MCPEKKLIGSGGLGTSPTSAFYMKRNFQLWLSQQFPVSYSDTLERRAYLPVFADALTELLKGRGYVMDSRWNSLAVARWIYKIHCDNLIRSPVVIHRNMTEDKDEYADTISDELLREFLERWKHIPDFNSDTRLGRTLYDELQNFLWSYIDLDESPKGDEVAYWMEGSDTESDNGSGWKVDAYIQDVDAGWHKSLR
jgi:hypothetical protein